jgi:hypothetical protein
MRFYDLRRAFAVLPADRMAAILDPETSTATG